MTKLIVKLIWLSLISFIFLLVGCKNQNEEIIKTKNDSISNNEIKENDIKDDINKQITIDVEISGIKYPIHLDHISEIKKLINELDEELELLNFQLNRIDPLVVYDDTEYAYILLNYNCGNKLCDYLIVKYDILNKIIVDSKNLVDSSLYRKLKISPDKEKIVFQFARYRYDISDEPIEESEFIIVNLSDLKNTKTSFNSAVNDFNWIDMNTIEINYIDTDNKKNIYNLDLKSFE